MEKIKQLTEGIVPFLKKHKKGAIVLVLAAAAAVGGAYFLKGRTGGRPAAGEVTPSFIRTTTLQRMSLSDSVSATGLVESANVSTVTTNINASVKSVSVAVGDYVNEGDVICTLDTSEIEKQITRAQERLAEQKENAQKNYDKAVENYEDALETYEDYEDEYSDARSDYRAAKKAYEEAYELIKSQIAETEAADKALQAAAKEYLVAVNDYNKANEALEDATAAKDAAQAALDAAAEGDENYQALSDALTAAEQKVSDLTTEVSSKKTTMDNAATAKKAAEEVSTNANNLLKDLKNSVGFTSLESEYTRSESAFDTALTRYENYESTIESRKESMEDAAEALEEADESEDLEDLYDSLEDYTLKAETSGYITALNATVGSRLTESSVATIQDTEDLTISISIAEYDREAVKVGMRAIITSDSIEGSVEGELTQIAPVASGGMSSSATFAAEVAVLGGSNGLLIGVNAKVELILSTTDDVFVVPLDAVGTNEAGESIVYVRTEGTGTDAVFEEVVIETGEQNDFYTEIIGDTLEEGMVIRASADLTEATFTVSEEEAAENESGFMMGGMPGGMSGGMPSGMPTGGMPSGMSGGMPSGMSGGMPSGGPGGMR